MIDFQISFIALYNGKTFSLLHIFLRKMEKVKEIVADIQAVITIIAEDIIGLAFSPIWYLIDIIEKSIEVCKADNEDNDEQAPAEEVHHITGFGKKM